VGGGGGGGIHSPPPGDSTRWCMRVGVGGAARGCARGCRCGCGCVCVGGGWGLLTNPTDSPKLPVDPTTTSCCASTARAAGLVNSSPATTSSAHANTSYNPPRAFTEAQIGRSQSSFTIAFAVPTNPGTSIFSGTSRDATRPSAHSSGKSAANGFRNRAHRS
jgi:hypothetical protein